MPSESPQKQMSDPAASAATSAESSAAGVAGALERRVAEAWPPAAWCDVPVVVAVSGGADSVALLRILARLRRPEAQLSVAHFHHGLRGAAADADEQFVARLADSLKLGYRAGGVADGLAGGVVDRGDGLEAAARQARYAFLTQAAEQLGARYLALAHTADDQAETILHRVLRGTGPAGLAGMPRVRPLSRAVSLVRPLLAIGRQELRDYLYAVGQDWREDATNAQTDATRNWIRHEMLPAVAERVNPGVVDALVRLGRLAGEMQSLLDPLAEQLLERGTARSPGGGFACQLDDLAGQPRYLVREALKLAWRREGWPEQAMGLAEWEALAELAQGAGPPGGQQRDFPGGIRASRQGAWLTLVAVNPAAR
jgi:tRNA(Ile)-lysidine synthase